MSEFEVQINTRFKEGILDPQAEAIFSALRKLEFKNISSLKCQKSFVIKLQAENESQALEMGRQMANKLLANLVMEDFDVELIQ